MSPGLVSSEAERPCREHGLICNFINQRFPVLPLCLPPPLWAWLFGFVALPGFWGKFTWFQLNVMKPEMLLLDPAPCLSGYQQGSYGQGCVGGRYASVNKWGTGNKLESCLFAESTTCFWWQKKVEEKLGVMLVFILRDPCPSKSELDISVYVNVGLSWK